jgi:hypothetical protein
MKPLAPTPSLTFLEAAGRWFLQSGIQEPIGGVARYYLSNESRNHPVSTEITGYALSALLFLYHRTGNAAYLDAALRSARFLTRSAWDGELGTFPFEQLNGAGGFAYFFDCGIIVRGLLAAWRTTHDAEFLDAAIAGGRAMLQDFPGPHGIHPILALPGKNAVERPARWSTRPGCYQLKSALAWHELSEVTRDPDFRRGYELVLGYALQDHPEFLPGSDEPHAVMDRLHAFSYFLEGLLPVLDRPDCSAAFRKGLDRAAGYLREIAPSFARSDVYAQVLRVRVLAEARGPIELDESAAAHEAERVASFQAASRDPSMDGGFLFGRKNGSDLPFMNPVSTTFCLQALALWGDRMSGRLAKSEIARQSPI